MPNIGKPKLKKGHFYQQSGLGQKGWNLNPIDYESRRKQFQDESFHKTLAVHDPLWRYIVKRYTKEIYDYQNIANVTVLGYDSLPIAIELSQWGYPVTFITDNYEEWKKAKKDCEIQSGKLKELLWFDYTKNVPKGAIICFLGILDAFTGNLEAYSYIDLLLRRYREVICSLYYNKRLVNSLEEKYNIKVMPYPADPLILLSIKEAV